MGYKVKWKLEPIQKYYKIKRGPLYAESKYTYKTKEGAEREKKKLIEHYNKTTSAYERKRHIYNVWIKKV